MTLPTRSRSWFEQVGDRDHERPVQHRVDDLAGDRRVARRGRRRPSCGASSHAASSGPMHSASGRSSSSSRVRSDARRERLVDVDDPAARDRRRPPDGRSNRRCSPARAATASRRRAAACSRSRSRADGRARRRDRADRARRRSRRARPRRRSCRARGGSRAAAPSRMRGRSRRRTPSTISARARRIAAAAGADASSALTRTPRATSAGIRRGLQHEMAGAPIVNPDRRAVGAEQPVGAVAEDVEAGRRGSASPRGWRRTRRAARGRRAAARRSAAGGTARARSTKASADLGDVAVDRRRPAAASSKPTASRPTRSRAARERQQQRRRRVEPRRRDRASAASASATSVGVPPRERVGDERALRRRRAPTGSVRSSSRPKPDVACSTPLRGLCSKSSEQRSAGDVERVLVQLRQQIGQACVLCASSDTSGRGAGRCRAVRGRRTPDGSGGGFVCLGASVLVAGPGAPRIVLRSIRRAANCRDRHDRARRTDQLTIRSVQSVSAPHDIIDRQPVATRLSGAAVSTV